MSTEEPLIRPCKGDCDRMTRPRDSPNRAPVNDKEAGTVARIDSKYCKPCYNKFSPVAEQRRQKEAEAHQREKEARLRAAFKAREDVEAGRRRRQAAGRRQVAAQLVRT